MKKFTIIHYALLGLSLMYCFKFYSSICIEIAIMAFIFDLVKPTIFIESINSKGSKKTVFNTLLIILIGFNLLAISSGFINNYNKQTTSKTLNQTYLIHQEKLKELKTNLELKSNSYKNYPSQDQYLSKYKSWEDKAEPISKWENGKNITKSDMDKAQELYNSELSRSVKKYKTVNNQAGYSEIFNILSRNTNARTDTMIFLLYMMAAIVFEILIFYTKVLSNKELKCYSKSGEEILAEKVKEINNKLQIMQLEAIENMFNKNIAMLDKSEEIKVIAEENQISSNDHQEFLIDEIVDGTEYKEPDHREELKDVKEITFEKPLQDEENTSLHENNLFKEDPISFNDYKIYFEFCNENLKNGFTPGIKKVANSLNIPVGKAQRIHARLRENKYI